MKSRMDKYYSEEVPHRTSKNDSLYDELYREKQKLNSNVTVIDNVNEIDIDKIKKLINNREEYKRVKSYNNIIGDIPKEDETEIEFDEINNNDYDINKIIEKKKQDKNTNGSRIRSITEEEYQKLKEFDEETRRISDEFKEQEKELKNLINTVTNADGDLFSNLKEDEKEEKTEVTEEEPKEETKENTFYTKTSKIITDDFGEDDDDKTSSKVFIIIVIISILIAAGVIVYFKFFK